MKTCTRVVAGSTAADGGAVVCNVYAISPKLNACVRFISLKRSRWGIYHSGLEVQGTEYSFGGHAGSSTGVQAGRPRAVRGARFIMQCYLGHCTHDPLEVRGLLAEIALGWAGQDYNPLSCNCNHFTAALSSRLGCDPPPSWINAFATARVVRTLLPLAERLANVIGVPSVQQVVPCFYPYASTLATVTHSLRLWLRRLKKRAAVPPMVPRAAACTCSCVMLQE